MSVSDVLLVVACYSKVKFLTRLDFDGRMTHITLGCGGHRLSDVNHDQPAWLATTAAKFGYGRVTVDDGYSLTFEFVRTDVSALSGFHCLYCCSTLLYF